MVKRLIATLVAIAAGVSVSNMDVRAAVGRTAGQFAVSRMGSAQYSIPIWSPPGPRGIQPNLSLFYDSHSSIGSLGIGWSIAGLGSISRCNKTVAQDTTASPVSLVASDGYCLNGNRLRLTSGTYGAAGSTYQTEIADFSLITAESSAGNGPQYFTVQGRNGLTYEYGFTDANGNGANSAVVADGTSTVLQWQLSKVIDKAGNNYVINYTTMSKALIGTSLPSTIYWTPTSAGASSYAYTMQFIYTSNVAQSSVAKYVAGTLVYNPELLQSIQILSSGSVVRDYFLGYQVSPVTGHEELVSVQECADTAKSNCLLPSAIAYEGGVAGVATTATTVLSTTGSSVTTRYDLNGDGYPDILFQSGTSNTWYVAFGSASGYGAAVSTGITQSTNNAVLVGNLTGVSGTGGSQDGILANISGTWWYYIYNGAKFTGTSTGIPFDANTYGYQLADINGDGLPDLVDLDVVYNNKLQTSTATIYTRLNTSSATTASFSNTLTTAYSAGGLASAQLQTPDSQYGKLRRYDFNGDRLDDLVLMTVAGSGNNYTLATYELLSTGTAFTSASAIATAPGSAYTRVFFTNWNDDACTDYVSSTTLYVSACDGTLAHSYSIGTVLGALDWDGDGRTDLLVANGTKLGVYLSTGAGVSSLVPTQVPYTSTCQYITMDVDGDGLDDLGCWSQTGNSPLSYYLHNGPPPDLANSFTDGFGNSVKPTYTSIIQQSNFSPSNTQVFPYQNYLAPYYEVNSAVFSDPSTSGGTYKIQYYYSAAAMNLQGRGFAGFGTFQTYDPRSGIWDTRTFDLVFPYTGIQTSQLQDLSNVAANAIKTVSSSVATETLATTANEERYFPYIASTTRNDYEVGSKIGTLITTTNTNYGTPDAYGNFDTVKAIITDEDSGSPYYGDTWTSTISNSITANTGNWCLNLPTQTTVTNSSTASGGAAITRTVQYSPDYVNCRSTSRITEPNSTAYKLTETYAFDAFGNISSDTLSGVGIANRVTGINWGTSGQFPTVITNALGQSVTLGYDATTGMKTSQTDPNYTMANPIEATWTYDAFARVTQENRPDGTYTVWAYNDCASDGGCLFGAHAMARSHSNYAKGGALQNTGTTYYDTVDRSIMSTAEMLSGYSRNEIRYDSLGRVVKQALPCTYTAVVTTCPYWSTFSYDTLNRVTQSQRPISASNTTLQTTTYGYAGRTNTMTDALSNTTTKINLVTGALARSKDAKGYYQNFSYDAFGSLTAVTDSASNALFSASYAYGIKAFQTASTDMDLGARSYTVDSLGEVTGYSDAKGQNFSQTYDALSRPSVRTDLVGNPDMVTTWTWGSSATYFNIGKLQSITAAGPNGTYTEAYAYDSLTRLLTDSISIPSDSTYTYSYSYDTASGLLETLTYPTSTAGYSLSLQYGYTNGILQKVSDANSSTVFWQNTAMNPRGQVTQEALGNGIVTNRAFDAVTGWVSSIQSGTGSSGAGVQNQSYLFDYMGNVTQRQDNNQGLTENFYYDVDYRLDHSSLNGTLNLQMTYDGGSPGPGNITARSDVAGGSAWTYDTARKHAVTQAGTGGYTYTYDPNGNATYRNSYSITWSSYNYPVAINGLNKNITLYYGPNRQYYEQVYDSGSSIEKTIYAGGLLEKVTVGSLVDWRHYIRVNNELIAIMSRQSSGANSTHYVLSDHEGSIAAITDSSAATTVNESFSAFGTRRNPSTWSGIPTCPDLCTISSISREGYTGHDAMGGVSMGINHMNGRIQDAITGRFLSADPTTSNPGNTQSWNRYSYVNNNPVSFADPGGFTRITCNVYCPGDYHTNGPGAGSGQFDATIGDVDDDLFGDGDTSVTFNSDPTQILPQLNPGVGGYLSFSGNAVDGAAKGGTTSVDSSLIAPPAQSAGSAQSQNTLDTITVTGNKSALSSDFFSPAALTSNVGTQFWNPALDPTRFVISGHVNHGNYEVYAYQLYDQQGDPLTGDGYSVEEHISPNVGYTSNDQYVPLSGGVAYDTVGWRGAAPQNANIVTTQTFSVQYQGLIYDLSTMFQHQNLSIQGAVTNTVTVITP